MLKKRISFAIVLIVVLLGIGTAYYNMIEGWSAIDSFYFSTMTLTTIGYGDLAPTTDAAKIFTSIYAIFGIGVMLYVLTSVIGVLIFRQEPHFGRLFMNLRKIRRHEKEISKIKKKVSKSAQRNRRIQGKEIKTVEKEIKDLERSVKPPLREIDRTEKKLDEQERQIKELKERLKKRRFRRS